MPTAVQPLLINEDSKPGQLSERNYGLFEPNGASIYTIHFSNSDSTSENDSTNQTYCTSKVGTDAKTVQAALDWACGEGKVDCSALMSGKLCFEPDTLTAHATYAFDFYYQQMGKAAGTCDFNGVATITSTSPDHGSCSRSRFMHIFWNWELKMSAKYILGAGVGSLAIAYVSDSLISNQKIFGGMNYVNIYLYALD